MNQQLTDLLNQIAQHASQEVADELRGMIDRSSVEEWPEAAKSRNPIAAIALRNAMELFSEEAYHAGWISNLEFVLWRYFSAPQDRLEILTRDKFFAADEYAAVRTSAIHADGWWARDNSGELLFYSREEWMRIMGQAWPAMERAWPDTPPQLTPEAELLQFAKLEDEIGVSPSAGDPKRGIADLLQFAEDAHDELRI